MTGKNLRFSVYVSDYFRNIEGYNDATSNEVLDIIRRVNGYYKRLKIFVKMNDGEWLHIFGIDKEDLTDEDETNEEMFIKEWVDCDLDDRSSWIPSFNKEIDEHGGFKFYPTKN